MTAHWFIDETEERAFTFAVVAIDASNVGRYRTIMSKLLKRGQSSLHFTKESDAKRKAAFQVIGNMALQTTLVNVRAGLPHNEARERAVRGVAKIALDRKPQRIVFERDETIERKDRQWLQSELGKRSEIEYVHHGKHDEPLLWIADGIAWALQRGEPWKSMVAHLVVDEVAV